MREVRAAPARHVRLADLILAVAQLGRAPGSGKAAEKHPHLLPRALTCFFIGKLFEWALSQVFSNELKKFGRWIKKWIKGGPRLGRRICEIVRYNYAGSSRTNRGCVSHPRARTSLLFGVRGQRRLRLRYLFTFAIHSTTEGTLSLPSICRFAQSAWA